MTGANGFIGSHIVKKLLERGDQVRAVVRDPRNLEKVGHLRELPFQERLELVNGDVLTASIWPGLLEGVDALVHAATAVTFAAKNPQRDIVDVAVRGTENVLSAATKSASIRSIVHLSSVAAIMSYRRPNGHTFTSEQWCDDADVDSNPYALAKTLSEQLAWSIVDPGGASKILEDLGPRSTSKHSGGTANGQRKGFSVICPGYVLGPLLSKRHASASPFIIRDMLRRAHPGCPRISFNIIDVRDVADGAIQLLEPRHPQASTGGGDASAAVQTLSSGDPKRIVMVIGSYTWKELAEVVAQAFPRQRVTLRELPDFLVYLSALFEPKVNFSVLRRNLGRAFAFRDDGAELIARPYRGLYETVLDTAHSMFDLGVVQHREF